MGNGGRGGNASTRSNGDTEGPLLCSYSFAGEDRGLFGGTKGGTYLDQPSFGRRVSGLCSYCSSKMSREEVQSKLLESNRAAYLYLLRCMSCGWWVLHREVVDTAREFGNSFEDQVFGEAKYYRIDSLDIPLRELRSFLGRHPNHLANVNPTAFELLMRDCLVDAYGPCDVLHTGSSGDGGVDLKMVLSNRDTYLVQVKRRSDLASHEGVRVVRELNGVLFREGLAKGMVITTAKDFTQPAKDETQIKTPTTEQYAVELLAFNDVVSMLRLPSSIPYEPWLEHQARLLK